MNIDETKQYFEFIANKEQVGNNPTPTQFNLLVQRAVKDFMVDRIGDPAQYGPNAPKAPQTWQDTKRISEDLSILLERRTFNLDDEGQFKKPDGSTVLDSNNAVAPKYIFPSALRYNYITQNNGIDAREVKVDILRDDEVGDVLGSTIVNPTTRFPKCEIRSDYIQVWPVTLNRVILSYLREPAKAVWAYTMENNRAEYDAENSVDIELPDLAQNDIVMRMLSYMGIHIREQGLVQYAEAMKEIGT